MSAASLYIGSAYLAQGDAETALEWFRRGQGLDKAVRSYDAMIVRALAALGRREEAEEILTRLEEESGSSTSGPRYLAMGYAAVGDLDKAFASLERAYPGAFGGADLPAPRSGIRAAAQRSALSPVG